MTLSSANCVDTRLARELRLSAPIGRGKSPAARRIQEYLWVNGIRPVIDGDWGDGTQTGLDTFCAAHGRPSVTTVDQAFMDLLAQPLLRATNAMAPKATLGASVVAFAQQQLAEHPIEIGGPNSGPWVRLYMDGNEGKDWLWCAGFVTYIIAYSAKIHGVKAPVQRTFSCDTLAARAQQAGNYRKKGPAPVPPGSVFLVPAKNASNDWIHTGLVLQDGGTTLVTAEGNTDQGGSSNGFEAASRIRAKANVDIVLI